MLEFDRESFAGIRSSLSRFHPISTISAPSYWLVCTTARRYVHLVYCASKAIDILEAYEGTLEDDYPPDNERCEHGEMLLYKNLKALLSSTKAEFEYLRSQLQRDLKQTDDLKEAHEQNPLENWRMMSLCYSDFIEDWVKVCLPAKSKVKAEHTNTSIDDQCVHCEKVEQIVLIGQSRCGGIKGLMTFPDKGPHTTDFIEDWVKVCLPAKSKLKAEHTSTSIDDQCVHCEKFVGKNLLLEVLVMVILGLFFNYIITTKWVAEVLE